jgi:hypothetical protein
VTIRSTPNLIRALNRLGPARSSVVIVSAVLAVYWLGIAVYFGLVPVGPGLTNRLTGIAAGDFMYFYAAGTLAAEGRAREMYDSQALTEGAKRRLGPKIPELIWPYPPTLTVPLALLGFASPHVALAGWIGLLTGALLLVGRLTLGGWRESPLVLLFPASAFALFTGQLTSILALLVTLLFLFGRRSPAVGGIALGLLAWKPHFAVVPGLTAVFQRQRSVVIGAVISWCALAAASVALFGLETWTAFFREGFRHAGAMGGEAPMSRFVSNFAAAYTAGAGATTALVFHALAAAAGSLAGLWLWKTGDLDSLRALGLTGAILQFTPYALDYDLIFLLLPWALMIQEARLDPEAAVRHFWPWLVLTCLVPVSYFLSIYTGRSTMGLLLLALLVVLCLRTGRPRRRQPEPATHGPSNV